MAEDIVVNFLSDKNTVTGEFKDIDSAIDKTSGKSSKLGSALGGIGTVAKFGAAGAVLAIGSIGAAAFSVSSDTADAARQMAASLGIPIEKAEEFGDVAQEVYKNNFGESVGEAASVIELLAKQIDGMAEDGNGMQAAAEDAFALRDVFEFDLADSVDAVDTLMENFGISSEEAFDLIAAGTQKGLDRSGDFLDTIGEYSTQFADGGATAEQFFTFLESGLQGGVLGTDKAADAFKEFRLRISDVDDEQAKMLKNMLGGQDELEAFFQGMNDGTITVADAFGIVNEKIAENDNATARAALGAAFMGTQFEDLGQTAAGALSFMGDSFDDVTNASESLNVKYGSFGDIASGISRRVILSITPLTDKLLSIAQDAMPKVEAAFEVFEREIIPVIIDLGEKVNKASEFISGMFSSPQFKADLGLNIDALDKFGDWFEVNLPLIQEVVDMTVKALTELWGDHGENITTIVSELFDAISTIIDVALGTILDTITLVLAAIVGDWELFDETLEGMVGRLTDAIASNFESLATIAKTAFGGLIEAIQTAIGEVVIEMKAMGTAAIDGLKETFSYENMKSVGAEKLQGIKDGAKEALDPDGWADMGRDALDGLSSGIDNFKNAPLDTISNFGTSFADKFKSTLGIESPSTVFFGFAQNILEGFKNGFKNNAADEPANDLVSKFSEGFGYFDGRQVAGDFVDGLTDSFNQRTDAWSTFIGDKGQLLRDGFSEAFGYFPGRSVAGDFVDGLTDSLNQRVDAWSTYIVDKANALKDPFAGGFGYFAGRSVAGSFVDGLTDGLNERVDNLVPHISSLGLRMADVLRQSLQISSPSKVTQKIAEQFLQPLENMNIGGVQASGENIGGALTGSLDSGLGATTNNTNSTQNIFQVTLQVTGDTVQQAQQAIDDLAFRYNANVVSA